MSLFGLLNLNKPPGVTSRDVVNQVQRLVRPAKIGHAGTLDPLARGVLVIGIGPATRLIEYVQQMTKKYRATFLLGRSSTTEDVEGDVTELVNPPIPSFEELERAAVALTGDIQQRPPAFSALKVAGRRAYSLARAGEHVELAARAIRVEQITIVRYEYPELSVEVECGSGTYVRSLGRDLAEMAGTAAVMSELERTAVGCFTLADALDPRTLERETIAERLLPPVWAVRGLMNEHAVNDAEAARLANGLPIAVTDIDAEECAAIDSSGRLVAILTRRSPGQFTPAKYLPRL